jgi:hypothetical protein
MDTPSTKVRVLIGMAGLLVLSNCATTQETAQQCRAAAHSFCEGTTGAGDGSGRASAPADAAKRTAAYQQCMETQTGACGTR